MRQRLVALEAHRRLAAHVPAGRQHQRGPQHALVGTATIGVGLRGAARRSTAWTRAPTSRGLSPPGGRKSRPSASLVGELGRPPRRAARRSVRPSQAPQPISASRGSTGDRRQPSSAAVSRARRSGLVSQRAPAKAGGSRQRADLGPARGSEGMSARPWMRPLSFQAVGPWRIRAEASSAARPDCRRPPRAPPEGRGCLRQARAASATNRAAAAAHRRRRRRVGRAGADRRGEGAGVAGAGSAGR